jgi:hypothetical protein
MARRARVRKHLREIDEEIRVAQHHLNDLTRPFTPIELEGIDAAKGPDQP